MPRLSASWILELRYHMEAVLTAPRSPLGTLLEQARLGYSEPPCRVTVKLVDWLDLEGYCRDLSALEEAVCRLRYAPRRAESEEYERNAPAEQVTSVRLDDGPRQLMTQDGEELVRWLEGGRSLVRGNRARYLSYQEIGAELGIGKARVQILLESARRKVRARMALI